MTKEKTAARPKVRKRPPKVVIGWREWVVLPEFSETRIKAKIDTGARTSAIHAFRIQSFERDGDPWVSFELHPAQRDASIRVACEAPVVDRRRIRSSNGKTEWRYVIRTPLELAGAPWPIELSLARRDEMGFRLILGRTALRRRVIVDPARSFLVDK